MKKAKDYTSSTKASAQLVKKKASKWLTKRVVVAQEQHL
jgi:hypothetical protein